MPETYFLLIVLGTPLAILIVALLAALFHRGYEDVLDWRPTRSPEREAELQESDVGQMLAAQNRYRRMRGAPERTLEQIAGSAWANLGADDDAIEQVESSRS
jgi:hypothetical protein